MTVNLTGKNIIITGASSGIGRATALECAGAGMNILITARREDRLRALANEIETMGHKAHCIAGDIAEPGMSHRLINEAIATFGSVYAVFANAGYGMGKTVLNQTMEEHRSMFEVNYFAALDLLHLAGQHMLENRQHGHLLMCSSCLSKFSLCDHGCYAATKAAQNAVCSAMRLELRKAGIAVSSVHPITTRTEFFDASSKLSGDGVSMEDLPAHAHGFFVQSPERVARAIVKCLRKPRGEVWTSLIVRTVARLMTVLPSFHDFVLRKQGRD